MTSHSTRSLHLKKLSFNESQFSLKQTHSPDTTLGRKMQQAKAYGFHNLEQNFVNPKTLSLVLNGNSLKLEHHVGPKSVKLTSFRLVPKDKVSKTPVGPTDIYPPTASLIRGDSARKVLKSYSYTPQMSPELKSYSPTLGSMTSPDLITTLNAKTEEINHLKRNIEDLKTKVNSVMSQKVESDTSPNDIEELQRELEQRDHLIELYKRLLSFCSKEKSYSSKSSQVMEDAKLEGQQEKVKARIKSKNFTIDIGTKNLHSLVDFTSNNYSFLATTMHKSTHPGSPSGEKNDSVSKITEQDSSAGKEESSLLPSQQLYRKGSSHQKNKSDLKLRALKSIYGTETKSLKEKESWATKTTGLSQVLNSSPEITNSSKKLGSEIIGDTRDMITGFGQEIENDYSTSLHASTRKRPLKSDFELNMISQFSGLMERLNQHFCKLEQEKNEIAKKNEEIMEKIKAMEEKKNAAGELV